MPEGLAQTIRIVIESAGGYCDTIRLFYFFYFTLKQVTFVKNSLCLLGKKSSASLFRAFLDISGHVRGSKGQFERGGVFGGVGGARLLGLSPLLVRVFKMT